MKNGRRRWMLLLYVMASQTVARCENDDRVYVKNDRTPPPPFLQLVRQKKIYLDKTGFIEYALRKWLGRFMILVAPPGWGKSTLFDMLQFFVEAELDSRYQALPQERTVPYQFFAHGRLDSKVFIEPPRISHHADLIAQYVARHPVIRLNFDNTIEWRRIPTYAQFLSRFKSVMLKQIRDRHGAAIQTLCSDGRNLIGQRVPVTQLYDLCNNSEIDTLNEIELRHYASKWANWLNIYYAKSPVILVDGYDTIFTDFYFERALWDTLRIDDALRTRIVDFFTDFLDITYRNSNSLFTLLTGVLPVDIGRGNYTYSRYSVVNHQHEDVHRYLGITIAEAFWSLSNEYETAKKNFGGYLVEWEPGASVLNPLLFWGDISKRGDLHTILRRVIRYNQNVQNYVSELLVNKCIPSGNRNPHHRVLLSFDQLQSMSDPESEEFPALFCSTELLSLLGYLTYNHDQSCFKIPNQKCRLTLERASSKAHMNPGVGFASTALIELLKNSNEKPDVFVNNYIDSVNWPSYDNPYDEIIDFFLLALYNILRQASVVHGYQFTSETKVTDETVLQEPISGPFLVIHNGTHGAVIEVRYGDQVANLSAVFGRDFSSRVNYFHRAYSHFKTLRIMMIYISPWNLWRCIFNAKYLDQVYYNPDQH